MLHLLELLGDQGAGQSLRLCGPNLPPKTCSKCQCCQNMQIHLPHDVGRVCPIESLSLFVLNVPMGHMSCIHELAALQDFGDARRR